MASNKSSGWDRRDFFQVAAAVGLAATAPRSVSAAQPSETEPEASVPAPTAEPTEESPVAGEADRDVLEVVLARPPDDDILVCHRTP